MSVFRASSTCAVVALRIVDEGGGTARRHNPRFGGFGVTRPGDVATFLGGACFVRRSAFEMVGGFDASFFYSMEEQDLAWRFYSAGWTVAYLPELQVFHPRTEVGRHESAMQRTWRNRVVAAVKSLPIPFVVLYLLAHGVRTMRLGLSIKDAIAGLREGVPQGKLQRNPMGWRSVLRLTKLGRPPIY